MDDPIITLASWPDAGGTWSFSLAARRRLLDANKGFDAESWLAELAFWVPIEVETESVPAKRRRAELANLVQAFEQGAAVLARLHPETRHALLLKLGHAGKTGIQVEQDLAVMLSAAREARDSIPGRGGRPPLTGRKRLIRGTCGWVERLPPLPFRASVQGAISRNAESDRVHVPLEAPKTNIERRCLASVKIVLRELDLPSPSNLRSIVRKVLAKKPT